MAPAPTPADEFGYCLTTLRDLGGNHGGSGPPVAVSPNKAFVYINALSHIDRVHVATGAIDSPWVTFASTLGGPGGAVCVDGSGDIYLPSAPGSKIVRVTSTGVVTDPWVLDPQVARNIGQGGDGNIYFLGTTDGKVYRVTTGGVVTHIAGLDPTADEFYNWVSATPNGAVWAALQPPPSASLNYKVNTTLRRLLPGSIIGLTTDDSTFTTSLGNWTMGVYGALATLSRVTTPTPPAGPAAMRIVAHVDGFGDTLNQVSAPAIGSPSGPTYFVNPGDVLSATLYARYDPANFYPGGVIIQIKTYTAGGANIDSFFSDGGGGPGSITALSSGAWTAITVTGTASAGAENVDFATHWYEPTAPGFGNPIPNGETFYVSDASANLRRHDVADIPIQALVDQPDDVSTEAFGGLFSDNKSHLIVPMVTHPSPCANRRPLGPLAGTPGVTGEVDGTGPAARFNGCADIAADYSTTPHSLVVIDTLGNAIRRVVPVGGPGTGVVTTIASNVSGAGFAPFGVSVAPSGNIYFTEATVAGGNPPVPGHMRMCTPGGSLSGVLGTFINARGGYGPWSCAVDAAERYVWATATYHDAGFGRGTIVRYDLTLADSAYSGTIVYDAQPTAIPAGFNGVGRICLNPDQTRLYFYWPTFGFADIQLGYINTSTLATTLLYEPVFGLDDPNYGGVTIDGGVGLAIGPDGAVYMPHSKGFQDGSTSFPNLWRFTNASIPAPTSTWCYTLSAEVLGFAPPVTVSPPGASGYSGFVPGGLAILDGRFFVTDNFVIAEGQQSPYGGVGQVDFSGSIVSHRNAIWEIVPQRASLAWFLRVAPNGTTTRIASTWDAAGNPKPPATATNIVDGRLNTDLACENDQGAGMSLDGTTLYFIDDGDLPHGIRGNLLRKLALCVTTLAPLRLRQRDDGLAHGGVIQMAGGKNQPSSVQFGRRSAKKNRYL